MHPFFRKLRQRFLVKNQVTRYLAYAIGEIVLVVIGILIALQVNNWNEARKSRERFFFGLENLYYQLQADSYGLDETLERMEFQLETINRILQAPDSLDLGRVPAQLQGLDDFRVFATDPSQYLSYLELNPADSVQNLVSQKLQRAWGFPATTYSNGSPGYMVQHLREAAVPIRVVANSSTGAEGMGEPWEGYYTPADLAALRELLVSRRFVADLKTYRGWKNEVVTHMPELKLTISSLLHDLESNYPHLQFGIHHVEVIGSGTSLQNWMTGVPMNQDAGNPSVWAVRTGLVDGDIKFRTDPAWTFDWGYVPGAPGRAGFKGSNIPVSAGTYDIILNISENTYRIEPVREP